MKQTLEEKKKFTGSDMTRDKNQNTLTNSDGFTLIEVMVAMTILAIVIIPLASFFAASLSTIQRSMLYSQALQLTRERIDLCQSLDYDALFYWNPALTPGFEMNSQINTNRDPDPNDSNDVFSYDPTDMNGDEYPIPMYRDYYDNSTGLLIDPNYNGLADDDLNGNGLYGIIDSDFEDIAIACPTPNIRNWDTDLGGNLPAYMVAFADKFGGTAALRRVGDGLYDTVVEGIYANSMDPALFGTRPFLRGNDSAEQVSPIIDFSLQIDRNQNINLGLPDYRHREQTFRTFARMTTIIDPTPTLADPNVGNFYAYADGNVVLKRTIDDGWTGAQRYKFGLCTQRDLPISYSIDSLSVGINEQGFNEPEDYTLAITNPLQHNYTNPLYGKKIIVTTFFLSGEGEQRDLDGDGFPDGETFASSNNVRMERMFYQETRSMGLSGTGMFPPPARFERTFFNNSGHLMIDMTGEDEESDPCSFENDGLPYLDPGWPGNI